MKFKAVQFYDWLPVVTSLIGHLARENWRPVAVVSDGERVEFNDRIWPAKAAADEITAVDEGTLVVVKEGEEGEKDEKGLFLVFGNAPFETVCDYHVDSSLDKVVDAFSTEWETKATPKRWEWQKDYS